MNIDIFYAKIPHVEEPVLMDFDPLPSPCIFVIVIIIFVHFKVANVETHVIFPEKNIEGQKKENIDPV